MSPWAGFCRFSTAEEAHVRFSFARLPAINARLILGKRCMRARMRLLWCCAMLVGLPVISFRIANGLYIALFTERPAIWKVWTMWIVTTGTKENSRTCRQAGLEAVTREYTCCTNGAHVTRSQTTSHFVWCLLLFVFDNLSQPWCLLLLAWGWLVTSRSIGRIVGVHKWTRCRWSKLFGLVATCISSVIMVGVNFLVVGVCCVFLILKLIFWLCDITEIGRPESSYSTAIIVYASVV